jgi:hypothetical protein
VARRGKLNSHQIDELTDELAALMRQQSDDRLIEDFIRMNRKEIDAFDLRTRRIYQIHVLLNEHSGRR